VRLLVISLATLVVAYGGLCLALYFFQARLVYFPGPPSTEDPARWVPGAHPVALTTSDGVRLSAWLLPAPEPRGALVFCHGNAGTIADRLPAGAALVQMGWTVLLFDYRGYGASAGVPSEEGTYRDAEAAYDHLVGEAGFDPARVAVYGESLGGGVAIELGLRRPVAAIVAESTFTSLPDMGASLYRFLPVRALAWLRYDNRTKIPRLASPLLLVHSPGDEIVPFSHAEANLKAMREPRRLLRTGGLHNGGGFLQRPEWRAEVAGFLEAALADAGRDS
jgi:fermentation-respiration switch protein FrsA (DUF1100 family)